MGNGKIRALELSMDNLLKELENSDISIKVACKLDLV